MSVLLARGFLSGRFRHALDDSAALLAPALGASRKERRQLRRIAGLHLPSSLAPPDARARLAEPSDSAAAARKGQSDGWRTRINNGPSGKRGELPPENPDSPAGFLGSGRGAPE